MSGFSNKRNLEDDENAAGGKKKKDNEAASLNIADFVDIKSIMSTEGPVVACVVLKADGSVQEIQLDTSPRKREAEKYLGGPCTMLGEWSEDSVVLIVRAEHAVTAEDGSELEKNTHKLQPPFHKTEVHGDILLMRLDEDSTPLDYTKERYLEFAAMEIAEWEIESDDEEAEDEEDEDDEDDEDGDGGEQEFREHLLNGLVEKFSAEHKGRAPNDKELQNLVNTVDEMIAEMAANEDDEDDDSGSENDSDGEDYEDEDDDDEEEDEEEDEDEEGGGGDDDDEEEDDEK